MGDSLNDRIYEGKDLTLDEVDALVELLGNGCRLKTKQRLRWTLTNCPHITPHGIFNRLMVSPVVRYNAGQHYPSEIRTVRECLIGK